MRRIYVPFLFAAVLGFVLSNCGTAATCSSATCGGCCNALGKCESGATADACGIDGQSCGRCGSGTSCVGGACQAGSGTGGGSGATGGGSGTTGGGSGGCRQLGAIATPSSNDLFFEYRPFTSNAGWYNFALWGVGNPSVLPFNAVRVEVVYPNAEAPLVPPVTRDFTGQTYKACRLCAVYHETCDANAVCQRDYLAQSGSMTIERADRAEAGRIIGNATNVRFVHWDLTGDVPLSSDCVEATSIGTFNSGWNADGGAPPP